MYINKFNAREITDEHYAEIDPQLQHQYRKLESDEAVQDDLEDQSDEELKTSLENDSEVTDLLNELNGSTLNNTEHSDGAVDSISDSQ